MIRTHSLLAVLLAIAPLAEALAQISPPLAIPLGGAKPDRAAVPLGGAPAIYPQGMVSAADPRAADAGAQMLRQRGSATDAAIATMLALNVVEPQSSGIGGGGVLVHGDAAGQVETIDGRETAPKAATPRRFLDAAGKPLGFRTAVVGGLSVGVPGNIALAADAHRRWGKLAWGDLFAPAIVLARDGWEISPRLHDALDRQRDSGAHDPAARAMFYGADGTALPVGTVVRNPALAQTLERIAGAGDTDRAFVSGITAAELARKVAGETPHGIAGADGAMTAADVVAYRAKERAPVCGAYRTYRICGMGPPSSGAMLVLTILGQLERFDLGSLGAQSPVAWHLIAESQRLAYADRDRYLADSDFVRVPLTGLLDPAYIAARSTLIRAGSSLAVASPGLPQGVGLAPPAGAGPVEHGTSHFVVVDRSGDVVSYTSTIESAFGSGLMTGGFYLNNELTDFSFTPVENGRPVANRVEGGKRPRSSMAPTVVYSADGRLLLVLGAAGGSTIPAQVAKTLIGVIDWRLSLQDAIALPTIYAPGPVYVERGTALEAMIPQLRALGASDITTVQPGFKANGVEVSGGVLVGAADPRSEGRAIAQ